MKHLGSASLLLALATPALAQVANGAFSADLAGWTTFGDAAVRDGSAFLTTAFTDGSDDFAGAYNFSGTAPVASDPDLESGLGLAVGALHPNENEGILATEGSALFRSVTVQAGDILSFDWTFLSNEADGADYAFLVLDGVVFDLGTGATLTPGSTYDYGSTSGAQFFQSAPFASDGTVTIGFGVVDVDSFFGTSALILDNVSLAPIPEPSAFAALAGLATLGLAATRRRRV